MVVYLVMLYIWHYRHPAAQHELVNRKGLRIKSHILDVANLLLGMKVLGSFYTRLLLIELIAVMSQHWQRLVYDLVIWNAHSHR